jgi:hypothetical protein
MFGGIIPTSRVKSSMSAKDAEGTTYTVRTNVAPTEKGSAGFKTALAVAGGKGVEKYKEGALTFSESADVFPSEASKVLDYIKSVAVATGGDAVRLPSDIVEDAVKKARKRGGVRVGEPSVNGDGAADGAKSE